MCATCFAHLMLLDLTIAMCGEGHKILGFLGTDILFITLFSNIFFIQFTLLNNGHNHVTRGHLTTHYLEVIVETVNKVPLLENYTSGFLNRGSEEP
jgi:hypothetical protein